jgi:hypothetical protein
LANLRKRFNAMATKTPPARDLIIGLAIEPAAQPRPDEELAIKSVQMRGKR